MTMVESSKDEISLERSILHDINNILAAIVGCSEILLTEGIKENKEKIELIKKIALDGIAVTNRRGKFNNRIKKQEQLFNICDVIGDAIHATEYLAFKDNKRVSISYTNNLPIYICVNESEFRESIINLIINSIDAIKEEGKIEIKAIIEKGNLIINISDNGAGIKEDLFNRIFEENFTTKGAKGTGLGLYNVKNFFEAYGGKIEVLSEENMGTTFNILLPLREGWGASSCSEKREVLENQGDLRDELNISECSQQTGKINISNSYNNIERILIIDDQVEICKITREMLKSILSAEVDISTNGLKALEYISKNKYDLIITDISMPGMRGIELTEKIEGLTRESKIVYMTGWGEGLIKEIDKDKYYILNKPFTVEDLKLMLENINPS